MATYILLSSVTDEGAKTIKENAARIKEVNEELEEFGVKVMAQYAVLGPFDFVNIVEAPDNVAIARASAELASRGSVKIQTLAAISIDEFIAAFDQVQSSPPPITLCASQSQCAAANRTPPAPPQPGHQPANRESILCSG